MTKRIAVLFSPDEAATIMELIRRERAQVRNTRQRPRTDLNPDPGQAPEVYLAVAPTGGIPANDRMGTTGTSSADIMDDVPGSAECAVYRMHPSGFPEPVEGLTRTVYNLAETAIAAGTLFLAVRDKWNSWFVAGVPGPTGAAGAAGSGAITVQEADGSPSYTTATLRVPSGASILTNSGTTTTIVAASSEAGGLLTAAESQNLYSGKYFCNGEATARSSSTGAVYFGRKDLTPFLASLSASGSASSMTGQVNFGDSNSDYVAAGFDVTVDYTSDYLCTFSIWCQQRNPGATDKNARYAVKDSSGTTKYGATGTFTTADAKTVTVTGGIITGIV